MVLLNHAGLPHELRVASLCRDFAASFSANRQPHATTQKIVYAPALASEYREVDQVIQLYEEFAVDELTGIQLIFSIPLECKHRLDVEYFAFPLDMLRPHTFPVTGDLAGSDYFRSLEGTYQVLQEIPLADLALVQIEDGRTPRAIHKENVIYNAASALYDFVLFQIGLSGGGVLDDVLLQELFESFQAYLNQRHYAWWSVIQRWMKENVSARGEDFNTRYSGGHRVHHAVQIYLPVVCVSGDLFHVRLDESSEVAGFERAQACVARIRKHGWPGAARFTLMTRDPEVPVVVTNVMGLPKVLDVAVKWFRNVRSMLMRAGPHVKACALESMFFQKVVLHYADTDPDGGYRSDLDITQWL
jgi:hypothetical protein